MPDLLHAAARPWRPGVDLPQHLEADAPMVPGGLVADDTEEEGAGALDLRHR